MRYVVKHAIPGHAIGDRVSDGDLSPQALKQFCVPVADDAPAAAAPAASKSASAAPAAAPTE